MALLLKNSFTSNLSLLPWKSQSPKIFLKHYLLQRYGPTQTRLTIQVATGKDVFEAQLCGGANSAIECLPESVSEWMDMLPFPAVSGCIR
jgi:hypothetical protein